MNHRVQLLRNDRLGSRGIIILFLFLSHLTVQAQEKAFTLENSPDRRISIIRTFSENTILKPFTSAKPVSGLAISCDINLNSDSSLVRVSLMDEQYREYLVCEFYPVLCENNNFSINEYAEETAYLHNIIPGSLKIELIDASIHIKEILLGKEDGLKTKATITKSLQQNSEKIKKINENLKNRGGLWVAGETSVSKLAYEEKMQMFGGKVPNLQGLEYYAGGIFEISGSADPDIAYVSSKKSMDTMVVSSFDWRNRHGANKPSSPYYNSNPGSIGWITPAREQGLCGSCWIFGPVGAIEASINLFFNQHIDIDLSEQQVLSCNGSGIGCQGGYSATTLAFAQDSGIVKESCFPYIQNQVDCSNKCISPDEKIKISGFSCISLNPHEIIKKNLINNGPIAAGVGPWNHAMTLIGFCTIAVGDTIYAEGNLSIVINPGDAVIGKTYYIFKNSWGTSWGNNGYLNVLEEKLDRVYIFTINNPIYSEEYSVNSIACNDYDKDGFYYWGLGPKPPHCPPCPNEPDGDDSDPCVGPMDEYGHFEFFTPSPVTQDTIISLGESVPELYAEGENITWYGDEKHTLILHNGNSYATGMINAGDYTYYVTQNISGCVSDVSAVTLSILPIIVSSPVVADVTIFNGDPIPELIAQGENIKWYGDPKNPLYDSRDGQIYNTTLIGDQLWMAENLNFRTSWSRYYDYDSITYSKAYGRLYNWNETLDGVCPINWHLPSDNEWIELEEFLGMPWDVAHIEGNFRGEGIGSKLKEKGYNHWVSQNDGATDEVNFSARPAGTYVRSDDSFVGIGLFVKYWTSSKGGVSIQGDSYGLYIRELAYYKTSIFRAVLCYEDNGISVRCVQNPFSEPIHLGNSYKPVYISPGIYTYYVKQEIFGCESPADTVIFTILSEVRPPLAENIVVCEGFPVPSLDAAGQNIRWYSDVRLSNILHDGNSFSTGQTLPGTYTYFVTQTLNNCESLPDTVTLSIGLNPLPPLANDATFCIDNKDLVLKATGENIKWYDDADLTNPVGSGISFNTVQNLPGIYRYYVTQTIAACESEAGSVTLTINPLPIIALGEDTTLYHNQKIMLGPFTDDFGYLWSDGSRNPYYEISGSDLGLGNHQLTVIVSDTNNCNNSDTISIRVIAYSDIHNNQNNNLIRLFPNPTTGSITIDLNKVYSDVNIRITELDGRMIQTEKYVNVRVINLQLFTEPGIYLVTLTTSDERFVYRILRK